MSYSTSTNEDFSFTFGKCSTRNLDRAVDEEDVDHSTP